MNIKSSNGTLLVDFFRVFFSSAYLFSESHVRDQLQKAPWLIEEFLTLSSTFARINLFPIRFRLIEFALYSIIIFDFSRSLLYVVSVVLKFLAFHQSPPCLITALKLVLSYPHHLPPPSALLATKMVKMVKMATVICRICLLHLSHPSSSLKIPTQSRLP